MSKRNLAPLFLLSSAVLLAACGSAQNKIGATVKGERIAVLEQARTLEADKGLEGAKPSLPREIINLSWPQPGYDSEHAMPGVQLSEKPQILWKGSIGEGSNSDFKLLSRPVVAHSAVYTMDAEGTVSAFDIETGKRLWSRETTPENSDNRAMGGGIAVDGDTLYATTGFGDVCAIQAKTGKIKWRKSLLKPLRAAPTVADDRIYVVSIDNDLNALRAIDGEILWHQSGTAENAAIMGASSPAVQGDTVVVAYSTGEIYGLRAQNGRMSWNYSLAAPAQIGALPAIADIRGLPVIDRGRVYAVSHSGRIAAIDLRSGDRVWESDIGGIDTPIVAGDTVFIYGGTSQLIALTRASGRPMWVTPLPKNVDPDDRDSDPLTWTGPVLAGARLWMSNSNGILASFSVSDGTPLDTIDLGDPVYLLPVVASRTFFVVTDNGNLIALR